MQNCKLLSEYRLAYMNKKVNSAEKGDFWYNGEVIEWVHSGLFIGNIGEFPRLNLGIYTKV